MSYLFALILPILYFAKEGKWMMFFVTLVMAGVAVLAALTIVGLPLSGLLWLIAGCMAFAHRKSVRRDELMHKHADLTGRAVTSHLGLPVRS